MSSGLYNEGLFREGLLRTTNLVRPGLITQFDTLEEALTRFAVNNVEAALALDFIGSEYRTANTSTTFAEAFTGNSPKLNYSTTSNSTMVNSSGHLVWAPHNLLDYSEDFSQWAAIAVGSGIAPVLVSSNNTAPDGTNTATRFQFDLNGQTTGTHLSTIQRSVTPNTLNVGHTFRLWVKSTDGTSTYNMVIANQGTAPITVDGTWRPVEFEFTVTGQLTPAIYLRSAQTPVNSDTADILIWGAHYYRSDLGGMAPVPGAVGDFQYYVPTNGAAEYLPRVGHHVYNGSTWVNEGLLIESEARTNLLLQSNNFSVYWSTGSLTAAQDQPSPDGDTNAWSFTRNVTGTEGNYRGATTQAVNTAYTLSVFAKAVTSGVKLYLRNIAVDSTTTTGVVLFDLEDGTADVSLGSSYSNVEIFEAGNGWYRCSVSGTTPASISNNLIDIGVSRFGLSGGNIGDTIAIYGAQLEQASTPSSYIPTSGSTVTRGAQSLTVPANWYDADTPTYTGPELVTNGGFATDTSGWTAYNYQGHAVTISSAAGELTVVNDPTNGGAAAAYQSVPTVVGQTYSVSVDFVSTTIGTPNVLIRNTLGGTSLASITTSGAGTYTTTFTATAASTLVILNQNSITAGLTTKWDNISVRQVSAPQFGWPSPEYIGPELVDNGTFDTDVSSWSSGDADIASVDGELKVTNQTTSPANTTQVIDGLTVGSVYKVSGTYWQEGSGVNAARITFFGKTTPNNGTSVPTTHEMYVVPTATSATLSLVSFGTSATESYFDNISVREINPLSVSIQMDGRMTYADEDVGVAADGITSQVVPFTWRIDAANYIYTGLNTSSTRTGVPEFVQEVPSGVDVVSSASPGYTPGVLVPFNIASRHGSTFINGAVDGVALTANTTPTALPDLSGTDLQIAYDFMGTIGQFRQFAGDVGNAGLVTATNPSTEPTLSLTFDGSEGSFYNLSWSE